MTLSPRSAVDEEMGSEAEDEVVYLFSLAKALGMVRGGWKYGGDGGGSHISV